MNITQYELRSRHGAVDIPADFALKAESLIQLTIEHPASVISGAAVIEHPYLGNIGILSRSTELANIGIRSRSTAPAKTKPKAQEYLRLQDIVYLRVCIYGNEKQMRGPEREKALQIDQTLVGLVEELESERS